MRNTKCCAVGQRLQKLRPWGGGGKARPCRLGDIVQFTILLIMVSMCVYVYLENVDLFRHTKCPVFKKIGNESGFRSLKATKLFKVTPS